MNKTPHTVMSLDRIKRLAERAKNGWRSHEAKEATREIIRLRLTAHHHHNDRESLRKTRAAARAVVQTAVPSNDYYVRVNRNTLARLAALVGTDLNDKSEV